MQGQVFSGPGLGRLTLGWLSHNVRRCFCKVVADPSPAEAEELFARAGRRGIVPNAVTYHELAAIQMRHEQLGGL